ncbi:unnamed protein product [Macrosiphum euphorbiae]|uniref:Uncharacterized protein n=1 Tax=Macrosiphum euphorbiae TaxID=13131 RepID=A0AAV0WKT5_9HEMI|nr:unnamed protein product [Macrosiphum euphorbiae]
MFPMQVLIVLSTIIIVHQTAKLNNENQTPVTTNYEFDKDGHEMLNNKTFYNYSNGSSESTTSYYFNIKNLFGNYTNSNETASPVSKYIISDNIKGIIRDIKRTHFPTFPWFD